MSVIPHGRAAQIIAKLKEDLKKAGQPIPETTFARKTPVPTEEELQRRRIQQKRAVGLLPPADEEGGGDVK